MSIKTLTKHVRAAIYARYSCDQQRETSIEDQIRRCKEVAAQHGVIIESWQVFTDSALSGQAHAQDKRDGYLALLKAWDNHEFDLLLVDEFGRLTRDDVEQALLRRRLKENKRVRMITADGIDTKQKDWELRLGLKGVLAQEEIRGIQHRVGRGMVGQLTRGYMIATPAFGYDLRREFDSLGNRLGTHWVINEYEVGIVREVFARREMGQSMHQIALWLNESGVACSRKAKSGDGGYWRPARVRNLLANPIYRGEFIWHGSKNYQNRLQKRGDEEDETTKMQFFARPQLRLVSDETWHRCNTKSVSRSGYGGGKHALAGLITCGCCGGTLVLSSQERCRSVYCAACTIAKSTKGRAEGQSVTVAAAGVQLLLTEALRFFLTPEFIAAFRQSLREKLVGDSRHEYEACADELKKLQRTQSRLSHMLADIDNDDEVLAKRYEETRRRVREVQARLEVLAEGCAAVDEKAVAAQLQVDPVEVVKGLFAADVPPERMRATLARLFPSIVLEGKEGKYRSIFRIQFAPGAALAMASQTGMVMEGAVELRFELRYTPDNRSGRKQRWSATLIPGSLADAGGSADVPSGVRRHSIAAAV